MTNYTPEQVATLSDRLVELFGREAVVQGLRETCGKPWPQEYVNRDTGKVYEPHHEGERLFVYGEERRYPAALGGEGGGKSCAGIIKTLERLRRSMSGCMVSPDMPHFKRSLWPEFQRWCPWDQVVPKHQDRGKFDWEPYAPFVIAFKNGARLWCGGMDEPGAWEGPNISFAHMDEMRRKKDADVLKVLDGRVRIPGPNGEPPQLWQTTTPKKHWLFEYYGPLQVKCRDCGSDEPLDVQKGESLHCRSCRSEELEIVDVRQAFKLDSYVTVLLTKDNENNLQDDFAKQRAQTLTEAEARVLLEAAWEDYEDGQPFLPTMIWWDNCREKLPPLDHREPMILSVDAATGRQSTDSDYFGLLGITKHPERSDTVAVRYVNAWQAKAGGKIDFLGTEHNPGPEMEIRRLCAEYNPLRLVADPAQLHDMLTRFRHEYLIGVKEFSQQNRRMEADTALLHLIQQKRIAHDGHPLLREHIQNADRKHDAAHRRMRMVKRHDNMKIDLAVCLSQGAYEILRLNL